MVGTGDLDTGMESCRDLPAFIPDREDFDHLCSCGWRQFQNSFGNAACVGNCCDGLDLYGGIGRTSEKDFCSFYGLKRRFAEKILFPTPPHKDSERGSGAADRSKALFAAAGDLKMRDFPDSRFSAAGKQQHGEKKKNIQKVHKSGFLCGCSLAFRKSDGQNNSLYHFPAKELFCL